MRLFFGVWQRYVMIRRSTEGLKIKGIGLYACITHINNQRLNLVASRVKLLFMVVMFIMTIVTIKGLINEL